MAVGELYFVAARAQTVSVQWRDAHPLAVYTDLGTCGLALYADAGCGEVVIRGREDSDQHYSSNNVQFSVQWATLTRRRIDQYIAL